MQIRSLTEFEEYEKCVVLQHQVWGFSDRDLLPARYMKVTHMHGGSALGAFDGERLIGFAFAQLALHGQHLALYSNILAVHPEYRNQGIGARLKMTQRQEALERGILLLTWAFDPLQARNAYLNLNKLGAVVGTYMRDMYGSSSSSSLHSGLGTDRLLAEWWLDTPRVQAALGGENREAGQGLKTLSELPPPVLVLQQELMGSRLQHTAGAVTHSRVALEIPVQISELMERDLPLAREWRAASRQWLTDLFSRGYRIVRLDRVRDDHGRPAAPYRTFYLLEACENRTD